MAQGSTQVGRQGSTGTWQNTIAPKSAEQGILIKQDEMVDAMTALLAAIAGATDLATLQSAAAAVVVPAKLPLVR